MLHDEAVPARVRCIALWEPNEFHDGERVQGRNAWAIPLKSSTEAVKESVQQEPEKEFMKVMPKIQNTEEKKKLIEFLKLGKPELAGMDTSFIPD